jgi:hypothetical protein
MSALGFLWIGIIFLVLIGLWTVWTYVSETRIEQPAYTVIERRLGYEIRRYEPYLVATVTVTGNENSALYTAFPILAGYIFGDNTQREKIAMTAPVISEQSQKIAMTAPVIAEESGEGIQTVSFVMPKKFTLDTLPVPRDSRISFKQIDEETVAVLTFRGWYSAQRIVNKKEALLSLLERDTIPVTGNPRFAGYNSPFAMPLLVRNEIVIPIRLNDT